MSTKTITSYLLIITMTTNKMEPELYSFTLATLSKFELHYRIQLRNLNYVGDKLNNAQCNHYVTKDTSKEHHNNNHLPCLDSNFTTATNVQSETFWVWRIIFCCVNPVSKFVSLWLNLPVHALQFFCATWNEITLNPIEKQFSRPELQSRLSLPADLSRFSSQQASALSNWRLLRRNEWLRWLHHLACK